MHWRSNRRVVAGSRALLTLAVLALVTVLAVGLHRRAVHDDLLTIDLLATALFVLALTALAGSDLPLGPALVGIVVVGAALQIAGISAGPASSDDVYRYGWDAKVQLAGVDPYRYTPADHALDRLRSPTLFPPVSGCPWTLPGGQCSRINRPSVHTIYPPVAQAAFTISRLASLGRTDGPRPMQVLGGLGTVAVSMLLAGHALRRRRPVWTVALWAWCPVTVIEVGNNGHIDWLAALLSLAALVALIDRRPGWAGVLLGAAIATKIYPGVLLASMLRRRPVPVLGAALALVLASYLPHVLVVGARVIGYLPGYLREENYVSGGRFQLLDVVLPESLLAPVAVLLLLLVGGWALTRTDPDHPESTAVVVMGIVLLITTPSYPWYALVLIALVAMSGRVEWLPLAIAMSVAQAALAHTGVHGDTVATILYAVSALPPLARLLVARGKRLAPGRTAPAARGQRPA